MTVYPPPSNSRRLLGRLRDVMAGGGTAEDRLTKIVKLIARDTGADVCSCYVMRAGEVLELFATEGLKEAAVHKTRLRVGEGLVGEIAGRAIPMAFADAWSHPSFVYRPETGEDLYQSLIGVPIIRGGKVIGVLVAQNSQERDYDREETEVLETVAMVLAELLCAGELSRPEELIQSEGNAVLPMRLEGTRFNGGIGMGVAVLHNPRIHVSRLVAEDPSSEKDRLTEALTSLHAEVDRMVESGAGLSEDYHDVLDAYRMFAEDKGWIRRIEESIATGLTAEAAVQKAQDDMRLRMAQVTDTYLHERLHDMEDLANRLLLHLTGENATAAGLDLPEHVVLVARNLGPAELLDYDRSKLRALVLEEGSATCHAAIIAKALDIPVVGRTANVLEKVEPFDPIIVDGNRAQLFVRPADDVWKSFKESLKSRQEKLVEYAAIKDLPAETLDGVRICLNVNAGLLLDVENVAEVGADGIGLYRTELPFMARSSLPDVAAQVGLYSKIFAQLGDKPVTFRTLDVGGDKVLPYWNRDREDNPAMGWRSIRITLDRPMILRQQLRSLLRAAAGRELRVMFPMVAELSEFDQSRAVLDMEMERERKRGGTLPSRVAVGTMLEVPALLWQMPEILSRVDFISIGSNDLMQFLFACDRGNPRLSDRYDYLSMPVLRVLRKVAEQCQEAGVPLSLCGEMAGQPLGALVLICLGFRSLSMSTPKVGPIKAMIRALDLKEVRDYVLALMDRPGTNLRAAIRSYARDHGIAV